MDYQRVSFKKQNQDNANDYRDYASHFIQRSVSRKILFPQRGGKYTQTLAHKTSRNPVPSNRSRPGIRAV